MTNNFIHSIELEGHSHTRTSPRTYTHVVVGRVDITRARRIAATLTENDRSTAVYLADQVTGTGRTALQSYTGGKTNQARAVDDGWTADAAANLKKMLEDRVAKTEKSIAEGMGRLTVLQWSMTEKNAHSGMRTISNRRYHLDLAVLPVASRVPATKRQLEAK